MVDAGKYTIKLRMTAHAGEQLDQFAIDPQAILRCEFDGGEFANQWFTLSRPPGERPAWFNRVLSGRVLVTWEDGGEEYRARFYMGLSGRGGLEVLP